MRSAPAGREAEFTEFVGSASARLLRAALVLLDSREEAEDALQLLSAEYEDKRVRRVHPR